MRIIIHKFRKSFFTILASCLFLTTAIGAGLQYGGIRLDINSTTGNTALTNSSKQIEVCTSGTCKFILPNATTLTAGYWFRISNESSTGYSIINDFAGNQLGVLPTWGPQGTAPYLGFYLKSNSSTGGPWNIEGSSTTSITSVGTFGSSDSATGATASGGVLTMTPASGANPGEVTAGAQTIAGSKTFTGMPLILSDAAEGGQSLELFDSVANKKGYIGQINNDLIVASPNIPIDIGANGVNVGQETGAYMLLQSRGPYTSTDPSVSLINQGSPVIASLNSGNTVNEFTGFCNGANGNDTTILDSCMFGIHETVGNTTQTGRMEFWTQYNGNGLQRQFIIGNQGSVYIPTYPNGILTTQNAGIGGVPGPGKVVPVQFVSGGGISINSSSTSYVISTTASTTSALSTCTTSKTIDWSTSNTFTLTLTSGDACTLSFSNAMSGQTINIWLTNGGSGGTATVVWPTAKWFPAGAPTMTTGTAALDVCTCTYNGSAYACNCLQNGG